MHIHYVCIYMSEKEPHRAQTFTAAQDVGRGIIVQCAMRAGRTMCGTVDAGAMLRPRAQHALGVGGLHFYWLLLPCLLPLPV
jgi:hypothetical protein